MEPENPVLPTGAPRDVKAMDTVQVVLGGGASLVPRAQLSAPGNREAPGAAGP